jgi:hypothetical protein
MATWHQLKAGPVRLQHATQWAVVIDPPNDCRAVMLFTTEAAAREYAGRVQHAYVLEPSGAPGYPTGTIDLRQMRGKNLPSIEPGRRHR